MDFKSQLAPKEGLAAALSTVAADALLVVVGGTALPEGFDPALATTLTGALRAGDWKLEAGQALYLHGLAGMKAQRVVVAAAGAPTLAGWRKALAAGIAAVKGGGSRQLVVAGVGFADFGDPHAEALAVVAQDAAYLYRHTKPSAPAASRLERVALLGSRAQMAALDAGLARGRALAAGVTLARECANRPGNHMTPSHLAAEAKALAREFKLELEVLERKDAEKLGMGAFCAVSAASHEPAKFIVLRYKGAAKNAAPIVLVGKGITFDTGGISLKPAAEMDEMKYDMGGAASVLGTFRAIAELKPKLNLVGIIPACENMPGGGAVKPGDVVTSLSGQTIEILNTDAEGRLVLCDALTYAERFKPSAVVDIATLTGACVIALGNHRSGLFATDEQLAADLLAAGEAGADPAWRMPLDDEYDEALKSSFADMANVGNRAGGAITAAMFLRRYARKFPWAHLDIAGTAWKSGAAKGGTGRPVPLLTHFVLSRAG